MKKEQRLRLISLLMLTAALLSAAPGSGQTNNAAGLAADGLTLGEAARIALSNNMGAESARSEVELAEERVRLSRASILPQIFLDGRYTRNDRDVTLEFGGENVSLLPENDWSGALRLTQPVYAGGRELKAIRQARLAVDAGEETVRQTEESVLLDVATSYLGVLGAEALVAVEIQNLELTQRLRQQATDFFDAGEVTRVDVLRAESSMKGAERRLAGAREARETAASFLRLAMGVDVPVNPETPDLDLPDLPSEEELIAMAIANRPEVQRMRIATKVADLEIRKQRGAYLPVVTAEASFTQQATAFPTDQYGAVTLNFNVPIFTSGQIASRVATAKEQEKQTEILLSQSVQSVREDVRRAIVALRSAETELALAIEQREAAEAEYEQIFELYQAQEATSLDAQSAEINLAAARRAVVTGTLDRELAELRVWYSAGALEPVLLEEK